MRYSILDYRTLHRRAGNGRVERWSMDFLIDGQSLLILLDGTDGEEVDGNVQDRDMVGCFSAEDPAVNNESRDGLLLKKQMAGLAEGRVALYVCPECGDLGCGAYTVRVVQRDGCYVWCAFAYENGYENPLSCSGIGPFIFEKNAYEEFMRLAVFF